MDRTRAFVTIVLATFALTAAGPVRGQSRVRTDSPPVPADIAAIEDGLRRAEYHFSWQDGRLSAPNRSHDLRILVTPQGFDLVPREEGEADFRVSLALIAFGRGSSRLEPQAAALRETSGRAEMHRGSLVEWLVNDERGVEHGFTLSQPPHGTAGPVVLELSLGGNVTAAPLGDDGRAVVFRGPDGRPAVHYAGLRVRDALDRELPARMFPVPGAIRFEINDAGAIYPVEVDPLATGTSWLQDSDQATSYFSFSGGTGGDVNGDGFSDVVIGAYAYDNGQADEGRVWVFHGGAGGLSTSAARILESNQASANFGFAVAPIGDFNNDGFDDIAVGAPSWDGTAGADVGAVFVYSGSSSGIGASPSGTIESSQGSSNFGNNLAWAGDVNGDGFDDLIVGAPSWDGSVAGEGAAFAYYGGTTVPTAASWTVEPSNELNSNFGISVAGGGDFNGDGFADVAVGGSFEDEGQADEGTVRTYHGSSTGLSTTAARLLDSDIAGAHFGWSVGNAGDVNGDGYADLIVGARNEANGQGVEGRVRIYHGSSTGIAASPAQTLEEDQAGAQFGWSVGTAGDVNGDGFADVIVGARGWTNPDLNEGKAFAYLGSSTGIAANAFWSVEGNEAGAELGRHVATAGDVNGDGFSDAFVGAPLDDNGQVDEGVARVYLGGGDKLTAAATQTFDGEASGSLASNQTVAVGDFNSDGYSDTASGNGSVFVHHGSATGLGASPATTIPAPDTFGFSLNQVCAGDVNGDGYDDLLVSFSGWAGAGNPQQGKAWLFLGSASGLGTVAAWEFTTGANNTHVGWRLAGDGDLNGDGFADVALSSFSSSWVFYGSATGLPTTPSVTLTDSTNSLAVNGDVNRDGFSDLVVGANVYFGAPEGIGTTASQTMSPGGGSLAYAGDVNGDGFSDVIYGSEAFDNGISFQGRAFLYLGSSSGLGASPVWLVEGGQTNMRYGGSVGSAGDVNGDGFSDIVVGARLWDGSLADEGKVFVYHGGAAGPSTSPGWTAEGNIASNFFGDWVIGAADFNGDGFGDLAITQPELSTDRFHVFLGNGGDGQDHKPRMNRSSNSGPLAFLSRSDAESAFRIVALTRPAGGRGQVRMDHEWAELGSLFDGSHLLEGSYFDSGVVGTNGSDINFGRHVQGLTGGPDFIWRFRFVNRNPLLPHTRWITMPGNGRLEKDIRANCETQTWYQDLDGDGHGTSAATQITCIQPPGYGTPGDDCDDSDPARFPGNPETCDLKDNDCNALIDDGFLAPVLRPNLNNIVRLGSRVEFNWTAVPGADRYDAVRGDLALLQTTRGDFKLATELCLENNGTDTKVTDLAPATSSGFWFLVRAVNCNASGTYDEPGGSQVGTRDAEIASSSVACP